ncbi:MAG: AraC family transcriptional regulator [Clostridiales bacterium]|nr:AraC family transcriptional regulator [Clostridiales bacterium]
MPKELVYGREVIRIPYQPLAGHGEPLSNAGQNLWTIQENLSFKRNSRFNPVPEHIHSYIELNYVYSGRCPQVVDGTPVVLTQNQVLLIDTDCPHSIAALGMEDVMVSVLIPKGFLRDNLFLRFSQSSVLSDFFINAINVQTDHNHFLLFHAEKDRRISLFFQELFCEYLDPSVNSGDIMMYLFSLIMAELINVYESDLTQEETFSTNPIVGILRYIEQNFATCTQASVAEQFHISQNYVSTLLKKHTGKTYIQTVQAQKLKYAANLLKNTDRPITEIASEAGYENISFFYKKFQKQFGCSPGEFRDR